MMHRPSHETPMSPSSLPNPTTLSIKEHPLDATHSKSPQRNSLSKTHFHIETRWGSLSLSPTKCLLLSVLILNVAAFCILLGLLIVVYLNKKEQSIHSVEMRGQALLYSEILSSSARLAAYSKNSNLTEMYIERYQTYYPQYIALLNQVLELIPKQVMTSLLNRTLEKFNLTQDEPIVLEHEAISLIEKGEQEKAVEILDGEEYLEEKEDYNHDLQAYVDYLKNEEEKKDDAMSQKTLASMIVVAVLMALVLPVVVVTLIASFNNEKQIRANIERAKAIMLNDTMSDSKLRELFKKHCEKEFSLENYYLLEKVQEYQALCEKSFEIQLTLFDLTSDVLSTSSADNVTSTSTSKSNSSGENKKNRGTVLYSEKDLELVEKQKKELALYIYETFLNINGSMSVNINKKFADKVMFEISKESQVLSDTLFDTIQKEVCLVMGDTHHRFKQSLAFQKKMKIDNIKSRVIRNK